VGVTIPGTVVVYLWFLYGPSYAIRELKIDSGDINLITAVCSLGVVLLCPVAGFLSDRTGPWRWYLPAAILLGGSAYPLFTYMIAAPSAWRFFEAQLIAMVIMAGIQGSVSQLTASFFPTGFRSSGLGLSINLGVALFGGLAPFYVTQLIASTHDKMIPAYYIVVAVVVGIAFIIAGNFGRAGQAMAVAEEKSA
jgi:MHS family proline/betaine transporter-like MFS transporter